MVSFRGLFWRLYFCMVKYLSFHNSSSFCLKMPLNLNGKATMWHTPCFFVGLLLLLPFGEQKNKEVGWKNKKQQQPTTTITTTTSTIKELFYFWFLFFSGFIIAGESSHSVFFFFPLVSSYYYFNGSQHFATWLLKKRSLLVGNWQQIAERIEMIKTLISLWAFSTQP